MPTEGGRLVPCHGIASGIGDDDAHVHGIEGRPQAIRLGGGVGGLHRGGTRRCHELLPQPFVVTAAGEPSHDASARPGIASRSSRFTCGRFDFRWSGTLPVTM